VSAKQACIEPSFVMRRNAQIVEDARTLFANSFGSCCRTMWNKMYQFTPATLKSNPRLVVRVSIAICYLCWLWGIVLTLNIFITLSPLEHSIRDNRTNAHFKLWSYWLIIGLLHSRRDNDDNNVGTDSRADTMRLSVVAFDLIKVMVWYIFWHWSPTNRELDELANKLFARMSSGVSIASLSLAYSKLWACQKRNIVVANGAALLEAVKTVRCELCLEPKIGWLAVTLPICRHSCCVPCLKNLLNAYVSDRTKYPLRCFHERCTERLPRILVEPILTESDLRKYDRFTLQSTRLTMDCPDCNDLVVLDADQSHHRQLVEANNHKSNAPVLKPPTGTVFCKSHHQLGGDNSDATSATLRTEPIQAQCKNCGCVVCTKCRTRFHVGHKCGGTIAKTELERTECAHEAKQKAQLVYQNGFQCCPNCGIVVEKLSGCNHMQHVCLFRAREVSSSAPKLYPGLLETNNANESKYVSAIHFCYCCGAQLDPTNSTLDIRGKLHFPNGSYKPCSAAKTKANDGLLSNKSIDGPIHAAAESVAKTRRRRSGKRCVVQ